MDGQPLISNNIPNESANPNPNPNRQQFIQTPLPLNNQNNNSNININNNNQIPINAVNMGQVQPQLMIYPQPIQSFIIPPQIDYSRYTNISQLYHMHINQIDDNTFVITKTCCEKTYPIVFAPIFLILAITLLVLGIYLEDFVYIIVGVLEVILAVLFFVMLFIYYHTINFILGTNNITIEQISWFRKKVTNYLPGQLIKVELTCQFSQDCETKYIYNINFLVNNNGASSMVAYFSETKNRQFYTPEEMGYFNYVMNNHIQTKMTIQNISPV